MADNDTQVQLKELGTTVESAIKSIQEIQDAVKEQQDASTLDLDRVSKELDGKVSDLSKQIEEKLADRKKAEEIEAALNEQIAGLEEKLKAQQDALSDFQKRNDDLFEPGGLVGSGDFQAPSLGIVKKGKLAGKKVSDCVFAYQLLKQAEAIGRKSPALLSQVQAPSQELEQIAERAKAYTETGSGTGDELVPTEMSARIWEDIFVDSRVAVQFETIDQPGNPFDVPLDFAEATFQKGVEVTAPSADDAATRKSMLTATELVNLKEWSYSLNETSIIAMAPTLERNVRRGARKYMDKFVMNADATSTATGNINLDDATPPASSYYLSDGQDGLRHLALVDNTSQEVNANADLNSTHIADALQKMDDYGVDVDSLRIFSDLATYLKDIRLLSEVVTIDKFGPEASVVSGQVANLLGSPVIPTPSIGKTEADGKISTTAGNNTKGQIVIAHRDMWLIGFVRQLMAEMDVDIKARKWILVVSFRIALTAFGTRSSAKHVSLIRNITI